VRLFLGAAFCAFILMCVPAAAREGVTPSVVQQHKEMLYPTVLVTVNNGGGSGTVIYSEKRGGDVISLVLTNHHVIAGHIKVEKEWNPIKEKKIEVERRRPVKIDLFEYNNYSDSIGTVGRRALIVAYDEKRDLALLQITDKERKMPHVAYLYPEKKDGGPWIFEEVYAVGAGLGKPPFPTRGMLAGFGKDRNGLSLWLATAPIIFGNSGGALFVHSQRGKYELIGVPSGVSVYGWAVVAHMGWARPITEIRQFLRKNNFGYILGDVEKESEDE
jgi:S1-C subfamily serine protease